MKGKLVLILLLAIPFSTGICQDELHKYSLEGVEGLHAPGEVMNGDSLSFYIRMTNDDARNIRGMSCGFRIYSPDRTVTWDTTKGDTLTKLNWAESFSIVFSIGKFGLTGIAADTISFGGSGMGIGASIGIPANFDDTAFVVSTGPITSNCAGSMICIDSSYWPPSGVWKWAGGSGIGDFYPSWDGPHCYTVVNTGATDPKLMSSAYVLDYRVTGTKPEPRQFDITVEGGGVHSFTLENDSAWCQVSSDETTTPATVNVVINPHEMPVATYIDTIWVSADGMCNSPVPIRVRLRVTTVTGVTEISDEGERPTTFLLGQNYPNPFNPNTEIQFELPKKANVRLTVYNVLGQRVKTLVDEELGIGRYVVDWDSRTDAGTEVASGVYFYRLEADSFVETRKMVLLK